VQKFTYWKVAQSVSGNTDEIKEIMGNLLEGKFYVEAPHIALSCGGAQRCV
jgi:hypothetical protein